MRYGGITLRKEQEEVLPRLLSAPYFCLFWEMRLGKTIPAAIAANEIGKPTLIVAPPRTLPHWQETLEKLEVNLDLFILCSNHHEKIKGQIGIFHTVIIDEIHNYRESSSRFKALRKITKNASRVFGLSGTIFDKNLEEIFYPWQLLDNGDFFGTNRQSFRDHLCRKVNPNSIHSKYVLREQYYDGMLKYIGEYSDTKKAPITPPKEVIHTFTLTPTQKALYTQALKENHLSQYDIPMLTASVWPQKALQILSGFIISEGQVADEFGSKKWTLFSKLSRLLNGRIVVWVKYVYEYDLVMKYAPQGARKFSNKNLEEFRQGRFNILICHPRSAGAGVDISCADHAIYTTESASNIDATQSKARLSQYEGKAQKKIHYLLAKDEEIALLYDKLQRGKLKEKAKSLEGLYDGALL